MPAWDQLTVRVLPNDPGAGKEIEEEILAQLPGLGYDDSDIFAVKLALDEALLNAIRHGNRYDRNKHITVGYRADRQHVVITVADEGNGFDPDALPDPTTASNRWKPNGRGVFLMRAYMDEVSYNEQGNQIWLVKTQASRSPHRPIPPLHKPSGNGSSR
jgi:serine/threonine-protein kinase RsbW